MPVIKSVTPKVPNHAQPHSFPKSLKDYSYRVGQVVVDLDWVDMVDIPHPPYLPHLAWAVGSLAERDDGTLKSKSTQNKFHDNPPHPVHGVLGKSPLDIGEFSYFLVSWRDDPF